ncbi:hypothetical protein VPH35_104591 [Triticum aestivum]
MDGGGRTCARTRDRVAEAAPDGDARRRRSHAPEAGQRRCRMHAPDGEAGWGRREVAPSRRGGQHGDGGRPHASYREARRRRRKMAARTGRGGWKATARGGRTHPTATAEVDLDYPLVFQLSFLTNFVCKFLTFRYVRLDQTVNSHVETMMLTDAPLLYTPRQVNQLHLPGMKEMRHANRKLKHCLDPSSHDEHKKYPLFCSIDKDQFCYGVIIITQRKAPSLIISMLIC